MSWDNEKRVKHLHDIDRIMRCEIDPQTKEELKYSKLKEYTETPLPDYSKFRRYTRIILRDEWGAIPASEPLPPLNVPIHKIHHSFHVNWPTCRSQEECTNVLRMLQLREMNERGLPDVRHNFLVGNDCNIYEGRGWKFSTKPPYDCDPNLWDNRSLDIGYFGEEDDVTNYKGYRILVKLFGDWIQFTIIESWPYEEMVSVAYDFIAFWKDCNLIIDKYDMI